MLYSFTYFIILGMGIDSFYFSPNIAAVAAAVVLLAVLVVNVGTKVVKVVTTATVLVFLGP